MYSQILTFMVALLLFTVRQPAADLIPPSSLDLLPGVAVFLAYTVVCMTTFRRLRNAADAGLIFPSVLSKRYHASLSRLSILALACLAFYVFGVDLPDHLGWIPGFDSSETVPGIVALLLYLVHLCIAWALAHPAYRRIHQSESTRLAFVRGHFVFSAAILVPWVLLSGAIDLMTLFEPKGILSGDRGQLLVSACFLIVFLGLAPAIMVHIWGCKPLPSDAVRAELDEFCLKNRFKVRNLMLWPLLGGEMLTAAVVGILPGCRYILITRGLMKLLGVEELKAVTAHEIGHVRRLHLLFYLFLFLVFSAIVYDYVDLAALLLFNIEPFPTWAASRGGIESSLHALTSILFLLVPMVLFFRFIFGFFLRNSERQADLYGMRLVGHPFTLISSLRKIALFSGQIEDHPNWHHYSIRERIEFLEDAYQNPATARRHNRKLYVAAILYTVFAAALLLLSPQIEKTAVVQQAKGEHLANLIRPQVERHPDHALLQGYYGGLLIEARRYQDAERALLRAAELSPEDPNIQNNLAWLYATAPPPYFKPDVSLRYAEKAAARNPDPTVLDTLAEAYHVNGRNQEAVETIDRAIARKPENLEYYADQKKKFLNALKTGG